MKELGRNWNGKESAEFRESTFTVSSGALQSSADISLPERILQKLGKPYLERVTSQALP